MLSEKDGTVTHHGTNSRGRYRMEPGKLIVQWEQYPTDEFLLHATGYVHRDISNRESIALELVSQFHVYGKSVCVPKIVVTIPESKYEVTLRTSSSDIDVFKQIFIDYEYLSDKLPTNPKRIVDLGANIGLATVYFGIKYPESRVVAVEPDPDNYEMLQDNVRMMRDRVSVLEAAAWSMDGEISLRTEDENGTSLEAWGTQVIENSFSNSKNVKSFRVDTIMQLYKLNQIDILKIDIEGSELELFSCEPFVWLDQVELLIIETHDRFRPGSDAAVRNALRSNFIELPPVGENLFFRRKKSL